MKRIGKQDYSQYILPAGIIIGGYFILKNFGLFGNNAGAQNSASMTATSAAGVAASLTAAKAAGDFATLTAAQSAAGANAIYNAGIAGDMDTVQNNIIQVNTLTDLLGMIQNFGTKSAGGTMCSLFGGFLSNTCQTYDMKGFVDAVLDAAHLNTVNNYLSSQGINYQF